MNGLWLDAHAHLWEFSLLNYFPSLKEACSLDECLAIMNAEVFGDWRVGAFLKPENYEDEQVPDRRNLDRFFGAHPAVVIWEYLHQVSMNTEAMERLGMSSENGVFRQNDVYYIPNQIFKMAGMDGRTIVRKGWQRLVELGYGRVIDMTMDKSKRKLFGKIDFYTSDWDLLDEALGFKIFLDGSLGMRTAALQQMYNDDPGNYGRLKYSDRGLLELVEKVHNMDKPVACHAIGDQALAQFLRVIGRSRHPLDRIDHLNVATTRQLDVLAELEIPVCISPSFSADLTWARQRLGDKRLETAYAWNLMREKGIRLLGGTDAPAYHVSTDAIIELAARQTGTHYLDPHFTNRIFIQGNWQFYNWLPGIYPPF